MNRTPLYALAFTLLATASAGASGGSDLLARAAALNPGLHSYTATMHAGVAMKSFPFLSASLVGTLYHKEPNEDKVVFTGGVPMIAQQFDKLYAHVEGPARWNEVYVVTPTGDNGTFSTFRLVPRKKGNIDSINARIDDKSATVTLMRWNYGNGGYAQMENTYGNVKNATLVTSQHGHVEEPGYTADITTTIDNYTLNPQLSDSIFEQ
ncbi:MAG: hypothetical protein JO199_03250 [Candidatus Eremiobacteraeota bacterium]|nr:hypothetical protein [Candidatus Eremiobacteraeota bacterium]